MVTSIVILILQRQLRSREVKEFAEVTQPAGVEAGPDPGDCSFTPCSWWPPKTQEAKCHQGQMQKSELWIEDTPERVTVSDQLYMQEQGSPTDPSFRSGSVPQMWLSLAGSSCPKPRATK